MHPVLDDTFERQEQAARATPRLARMGLFLFYILEHIADGASSNDWV